ncbi:hypothetical protein [Methylovulum psychrotolerans]|uniref:Dynamin family protein n=1 Tax=Methylovulum psychrotolerans TaxID=1704499 RepID=A0A2S5CIV0_9GAMM|nr:hypothetical protein [Methylovulum psychrotolerans]POZ50740.1 hypothetical protein AADEFJLK_03637 [Methylovulum psychrotolerans]
MDIAITKDMNKNISIINKAIQSFNDKMTEKIVDEIAVVHIIGAFSAGKSRLVRELLRPHKTAHALLPISSQERQTALPLEITYAESPRLLRIDSDKNETLLSAFPVREEQQRFDANSHYLRLELPEPALLMGNVCLCSAEEGIKRVILKDMPGWNSGDSFVAENPLANGLVGADNISLVYVVRANGVDSQDDLCRLQAIFEAIETDDAFFYNDFHLVVVVTRCDNNNEHTAITQRITERLQQLAEQVGIEDTLHLTVLCVEFGKEQDALNHERFINDFWQTVFAPIAQEIQDAPATDWATRLQHWQADWLIQTKLSQSLRLIKDTKHFVEQFKKQDQFVANMNNTRLLGLSEQERRAKVHGAWLKQVGQWQSSIQQLQLSADHPLAVWWQSYWLTQLHTLIDPVDSLVLTMEAAIQQLPIDAPDLARYFHDRIESSYLQAVEALQSHFLCVCEAIDPIQHDGNQAKLVATVLSLSILDAKYTDYYQLFKAAQ